MILIYVNHVGDLDMRLIWQLYLCRSRAYQLVNMINGTRILRLMLIVIDYNLILHIIMLYFGC